MARQVRDWIKGFVEFSKPFNTGPLFKEWMGVWQIGTSVGRALGMKLRGQFLAPNLLVLLIAGPGSGKSQAVQAARKIILPATGISLIPASVTRAGLIDYMVENLKTRRAPDGSMVPSNECIALSDEMQGILPEHDIGHLTLYNELWGLPSTYRARTRGHGEFNLQLPYCSIITGAQPAYLHQMLPEQAWGMGFMRRAIMVFDMPQQRSDAFEFEDVDHALQTKLISDLKAIKNSFGYFKWEDEAKAFYRTWWVEHNGAPVPTSKRLSMGYNSSRDLTFFKLSMIFSLSRSNELIVTVADAARALELLTRTEDRMRHIFAEMSSTGAVAAYGDVVDAIRARTANGAAMPEADLIHMLMDRFPPTQIDALIENLLKSDVIRRAPGSVDGKGFRKFVLGSKLSPM